MEMEATILAVCWVMHSSTPRSSRNVHKLQPLRPVELLDCIHIRHSEQVGSHQQSHTPVYEA